MKEFLSQLDTPPFDPVAIISSIAPNKINLFYLSAVTGMTAPDTHGTMIYVVFNDECGLRIYNLIRRPGNSFEVNKEDVTSRNFQAFKIINRIMCDTGSDDDKANFIEKFSNYASKGKMKTSDFNSFLAEVERFKIVEKIDETIDIPSQSKKNKL